MTTSVVREYARDLVEQENERLKDTDCYIEYEYLEGFSNVELTKCAFILYYKNNPVLNLTSTGDCGVLEAISFIHGYVVGSNAPGVKKSGHLFSENIKIEPVIEYEN